jgi:gas vesicle protein
MIGIGVGAIIGFVIALIYEGLKKWVKKFVIWEM